MNYAHILIISLSLGITAQEMQPSLIDLLQQCKESRTLWQGSASWKERLSKETDKTERTIVEKNGMKYTITTQGSMVMLTILHEQAMPIRVVDNDQSQKIGTMHTNHNDSYSCQRSYRLEMLNGQSYLVQRTECSITMDKKLFLLMMKE